MPAFLPVLLAVGAVAGLITWGQRRSSPAEKEKRVERQERIRLSDLKQRPTDVLRLDEAEDGAVLARRFGDRIAEGEFRKHVARLRKTRAPI